MSRWTSHDGYISHLLVGWLGMAGRWLHFPIFYYLCFSSTFLQVGSKWGTCKAIFSLLLLVPTCSPPHGFQPHIHHVDFFQTACLPACLPTHHQQHWVNTRYLDGNLLKRMLWKVGWVEGSSITIFHAKMAMYQHDASAMVLGRLNSIMDAKFL